MGQVSVDQRPLLNREMNSCEEWVDREYSVVELEQIGLFEGCLDSPIVPSSGIKNIQTRKVFFKNDDCYNQAKDSDFSKR